VEALEASACERYLALAVLLDDMPAAPAVQQTLWSVDEGEAFETAEQFVSLSLAQRDADGGGIRLHDLQLDYVRAQYPDRGALGLIHAAVRLSWHVIESDPDQFASQLTGRLLPHSGEAGIRAFCSRIAAAAPMPWLRPLWPALHPPRTELVRTLEGHTGSLSGVALVPDGKAAVSASADRTLKLWDLESGRALRTLEGHADYVYGVAVMPDGKRWSPHVMIRP
jgi:WD40 repeat protein